jgi:hypothetical protein
MDSLDAVKMEKLICQLRQVQTMSELKQLARHHQLKKEDFLKMMEKNCFNRKSEVLAHDPRQHRIAAIEE